MFFFVTNIFSQMQKGDKSVGFSLFIRSTEGITLGNFNGSYSQMVSNHIKLSVGPGFMITSTPGAGTFDPNTGIYTPGENEVTVTFSSTFDGLYYFSNKARFSPFVGVGFFGTKSFTMVDFPIGANYFINKNVSWNTALRMGVGFTSVETGATSSSTSSFSVLFTTGLEFNF